MKIEGLSNVSERVIQLLPYFISKYGDSLTIEEKIGENDISTITVNNTDDYIALDCDQEEVHMDDYVDGLYDEFVSTVPKDVLPYIDEEKWGEVNYPADFESFFKDFYGYNIEFVKSVGYINLYEII